MAFVDWINGAEIDCAVDIEVNTALFIPAVDIESLVIDGIISGVSSFGIIWVLVAVLIFTNVVDEVAVVVFRVVRDDVVTIVIIEVLDNDSIMNDEWK